ncbi:MAG: hypothetical protein WD045_10170 [Pirellulaceae bacterium]
MALAACPLSENREKNNLPVLGVSREPTLQRRHPEAISPPLLEIRTGMQETTPDDLRLGGPLVLCG